MIDGDRIVKVGRASYRQRARTAGKPSWELNYWVEDELGRRRREFHGGFATRAEAEGYHRRYVDDVLEGKRLWAPAERREPGRMLSDLIEDFHTIGSAHKGPPAIRTDRLATAHLIRFLGDRPAAEISRREIDAYLGHRADLGRSERTRNRERTALRRMFGLAVEWGMIESDPTRGCTRAREPELDVVFLEEAEQRALLEAAAEVGAAQRNEAPYLRPLLAMALNTGMRRAELFNARWGEIDWRARSMRVINRDGFRTKNRRHRVIGLNTFAVAELRDWEAWWSGEILRARERAGDKRLHKQLREKARARLATLEARAPAPSRLIFPSMRLSDLRGEALPLDNVRKSLEAARRLAVERQREAARQAGGVPPAEFLRRVGLHVLRHTFAVMMARAGVPLPILSRMMGHEAIATTQIYLRFYPDEGLRLVDRIAPQTAPPNVIDVPRGGDG